MLYILQAPLRWMRSLYDWVLQWSHSKNSQTALFLLAVAEASFFPVPPDTLLIALCMGDHKKWFRFALICSIGSTLGGIIGYLISHYAFALIGETILSVTASLSGTNPDELLKIAEYWFNKKEIWGILVGPWAVGVAGFTPIPYKVFTIAAGFFKMSFIPFVIASVISRSLRFFVVSGTIGLMYKKYGNKIQEFIDKYFNLLAAAFVLLLFLGFFALKLIKG